MKIFISHNKADKELARLLAITLVEQGVDVWFDEWELRPGDSIVGGIEEGLSGADVFVLVWSELASRSKWVSTELRACIRRRVEEPSFRIVPVLTDETPLPVLVAEYRGFRIDKNTRLYDMARELTGFLPDIELAQRLQRRLLELTYLASAPGDPLPYLVCPSCGSSNLDRSGGFYQGENYYTITCKDCNWGDLTQ